MAFLLWNVLLPVIASATPPPPVTVAHIHGRIVAIDARRGTFQIHHDPFPMMPMAMTMDVAPVHRADLAHLHVGEIVDATVDTAIVPWPGRDIHPAGAVR
jgi:Cu/Ag efflux protein CusF